VYKNRVEFRYTIFIEEREKELKQTELAGNWKMDKYYFVEMRYSKPTYKKETNPLLTATLFIDVKIICKEVCL
jgi:hypothetical protein